MLILLGVTLITVFVISLLEGIGPNDAGEAFFSTEYDKDVLRKHKFCC